MTIKLLFASAFLLGGITSTQAQILVQDNFDSYQTGALGNDLTGLNVGQGNWYTVADLDGNLTDFNVRPEPGKGNVLEITSPNVPTTQQFNNGRFAWKEFAPKGWNGRTSGNNILRVEYEFYTGTFQNSDAFHRNITEMADGTIIAGFQYEPANGRLRGMTRLNMPGVTGLKFILLGPSQGDLFLKPDTWVKVYVQIDYAKNLVTFQIPSENVDAIVPTVTLVNDLPVRNFFAAYLLQGNFSAPVSYDDYMVSAVNTTSLSLQHLAAETFRLYPNPVMDHVTVNSQENFRIARIALYDVNGRRVLSKAYAGEHEIQLDLSAISPGAYHMHITTQNGTAVKKLLKK